MAVVKGADTLYSGTVSWESPGSFTRMGTLAVPVDA